LAGEHFQTADLLRQNGADLDIRGEDGRNPLHGAAYSGNSEVVRILIEYDPAYIHVRDKYYGWTPLHWASGSDYFKDGSVVRLLLEHGADINVQDHVGQTPLHWASFNGALEIGRLLLEHHADVEAKDNNGKTALQVAAEEGHGKVGELLREYGAK
jgi:ankyrin repeat protein